MYTMGENSIFKKAQEAKNKTEEAIQNEQEYMNSINNMVNEYLNRSGNGGGINTPTDVPIENIKSDWATIEKIAKEIAKDDTITNDTEEVTVVVDNKKYTISAGDIFEVEYEGKTKRVRVLGFKHDDLVEQAVYGEAHEKASISFEFLDFMTGDTYKQMNISDTNSGGWASTTMRTFLNGAEGKDKLNNKDYIKQIKKKYITTYNSASSVTTCNDYLWLLAASEILNSGHQNGYYAYAITSEGNQYKYYKGVSETWNANSMNRVKKTDETGSAHWWWLRSPYCNSEYSFCIINSTGSAESWSGTSVSYGVAPGFCI